MFRIIIFSFLLLLSGCARQPATIINNSLYSVGSTATSQLQTNSNLQSSATNLTASVIPVKSDNFRGLVILNPQQRTIRLCNNNTTFNLQANKQLFAQMQQRKGQVYVEFEGQLNQSIGDDFQRAIIKVEQLHYLSSDIVAKCQQRSSQTRFELSGAESNWQGFARGNNFIFKIKDINSHWTIKKSIVTKGISAIVETENNQGEQLNILFVGHGCRDNKNDFWQYQIKLRLKNKEITGCGKYQNQQYEVSHWLGHYSYSNRNVSIALTLAEHHNAKVNYQYSNGITVTETGYWHLFGASGLKLVLTQRAADKTNIVFHFRRDEMRLLTSQQWRDNKKYSFNGALLVLDRMTAEVDTVTTTAAQPSRQFNPLTQRSPTHTTPAINAIIKQYFQMHKTASNNRKYLYAEYDLNGNGREDLLVILDWCQGSSCVLLVFENQATGYKFISRTTDVSTPIQISRNQQYNWQSLLLKQRDQWQQLDFNGISYPASSRDGSLGQAHNFTGVELISDSLSGDWGIPIE